jgi:hypothetical protein
MAMTLRVTSDSKTLIKHGVRPSHGISMSFLANSAWSQNCVVPDHAKKKVAK